MKALAWSKANPFGAEFAEVRLGGDRLVATGVALGSEPMPYRPTVKAIAPSPGRDGPKTAIHAVLAELLMGE